MNWIWTVVLIFGAFLALMSIKHTIHFKFKRNLYFLIFFFIALAIASNYVNISAFFGEGNFFAETGAAIYFDLKDAIGDREDAVESVKGELSEKADDIAKRVNNLPGGYSLSKNSD